MFSYSNDKNQIFLKEIPLPQLANNLTFNDLSFLVFDAFNKDSFDDVKNAFAYIAAT